MIELDHLVYAVADLEAATRWLADATGVTPAFGGSHPGRGTHNALASFGDSYLELIAPDPSQPAPEGSRPFGLDELAGEGLVAFAVRPLPGTSIGDVVGRARSKGLDLGPVIPMSRSRPDGSELDWHLTLPTGDGTIPFVIDWGTAERPAATAPGGLEILDLHASHPDPLRVRSTYATLQVGVPVLRGDRAGLHARIRGAGGTVELSPAPR